MTSSTNRSVLSVAGIVLTAILAAACDDTLGQDGAGAHDEVAEAPAAQVATPGDAVDDALALDLERTLRRIERGDAKRADAEALARIVDDEKLPAEAVDRASMGLSRALEATGDLEGAIRAVEALLQRHPGDAHFDLLDAARTRLRLLVSGTEEEPPSYQRNMEPMAAVTKALAPYFPEDDRGTTLVDVLTVGRAPRANDPHGLFNFRQAKRELSEEACAVCDTHVRVGVSHSGIDSWLDLPMQRGETRTDMPNPDRSLVIVYFDLAQNRVPSRYDAYLALPSAETIARLERGEAFVATKHRPGKKPLVLLAAPRAGTLEPVIAAFAAMTELPSEPVVVEVPKKLQPDEIQGVVRSGFKKFRVCYETLLKVDPKAAGEVKIMFKIDGEGLPQAITTESTMPDAQVGKCVADHMATLRFPATGETLNITYPIAFSP